MRRNVTTTVIKRVKVTRNGKRVTVRRKVKRKVRHDLIRNPKTCAGSWVARVTVRVAGSDRVRDVPIPCMAGMTVRALVLVRCCSRASCSRAPRAPRRRS